MDPDMIDAEYEKLLQETAQTSQSIADLSSRLLAASQAGDPNAAQWLSELQVIAGQVRDEQVQVQSLLQAMHGFTVSTRPTEQSAGEPRALRVRRLRAGNVRRRWIRLGDRRDRDSGPPALTGAGRASGAHVDVTGGKCRLGGCNEAGAR
jgi:hypothetical protein